MKRVRSSDNKQLVSIKRFINNETTVGYVFAIPFIIGFLGFTIVPIISSFYYSFTDYSLIDKEAWVGIDNYVKLMGDKRFWNSVFVTFKYVIISVPLKLIFALFIAMIMTRKTKLTGM